MATLALPAPAEPPPPSGVSEVELPRVPARAPIFKVVLLCEDIPTGRVEPGGDVRAIVTNAGADGSVVLNRVLEGSGEFGFNALTNQFGDLTQMGVLDPVKVTRSALQNSGSIAGLVLTTDCLIAREPEKKAGNRSAEPELED